MEFKEKLAKITEKSKSCAEQSEQDNKIWIEKVQELYQNIQNWFAEYIQQGYIDIEFPDRDLLIEMGTELIDEYDDEGNISLVREVEKLTKIWNMELNIGGKYLVILEPTGINIIGAFGKINLYFQGHKDEQIFLLLIKDEKEGFYWELLRNRKQKDKILFTKESFEKLLDEWLEKWAEI